MAIIDFSCADEIAARLVCDALARPDQPLRFYLFTGLDKHHLDPVVSALRRRALAVTAERADGTPCLLGEAGPRPRGREPPGPAHAGRPRARPGLDGGGGG